MVEMGLVGLVVVLISLLLSLPLGISVMLFFFKRFDAPTRKLKLLTSLRCGVVVVVVVGLVNLGESREFCKGSWGRRVREEKGAGAAAG